MKYSENFGLKMVASSLKRCLLDFCEIVAKRPQRFFNFMTDKVLVFYRNEKTVVIAIFKIAITTVFFRVQNKKS